MSLAAFRRMSRNWNETPATLRAMSNLDRSSKGLTGVPSSFCNRFAPVILRGGGRDDAPYASRSSSAASSAMAFSFSKVFFDRGLDFAMRVDSEKDMAASILGHVCVSYFCRTPDRVVEMKRA